MLLKPDDVDPMVQGETRRFLFKLGGAVGVNSIDSFSIVSNPARLSFGVPSISGTNVTVPVNADAVGDFTLIATAELSSAEIVVGHVRVKVIEVGGCR